jgi:AraC-like DNA-binding protein
MTSFDLGIDAPVLQPAYVRLLCEVLRKKGIDLSATLRDVGLGDWAALQARDELLSVRQINQVVAAAAAAGFDDRLALDVGALLQVSVHGPLGYAVVASPHLLAALEAVHRFAIIRNAAMQFVFRNGPSHGILGVRERVDLGPSRTFLLTCVAITIAQVAAAVHAGESGLQAVTLPFARPVWSEQLEARLRCPCQFDAAHLGFRWTAEDLARPNSTADAQAYGDALRTCEQQLGALQSQTLTQQVRAYLLARESSWPELQDVARHHLMSPRTLIRHLKVEGTHFQALRDELRAQRAEFYLTRTSLPIEEIAHRLGYQDTSNFSRSFRRWFTMTPGGLRQAARAQSHPRDPLGVNQETR